MPRRVAMCLRKWLVPRGLVPRGLTDSIPWLVPASPQSLPLPSRGHFAVHQCLYVFQFPSDKGTRL